jgi:hypothetical protein
MNWFFRLFPILFPALWLSPVWGQADDPNKPVRMNLGADPIVMTPAAFEAATAREIAKLGPVVKGSGAKLE